MITFEEFASEEIGFEGQLGFGSKRREMLSVRTETCSDGLTLIVGILLAIFSLKDTVPVQNTTKVGKNRRSLSL